MGAVCQAVGGMFSTLGMKDDGCGALEATIIRLLVAGIATVLMLMARKGTRKELFSTFGEYDKLKFVIPATAIGTWLGIWLSQVAYKYADLAVAQTLMSTCPLFAIPLVWIAFGHKATRLAILGTGVAMVGIWLTVQK